MRQSQNNSVMIKKGGVSVENDGESDELRTEFSGSVFSSPKKGVGNADKSMKSIEMLSHTNASKGDADI